VDGKLTSSGRAAQAQPFRSPAPKKDGLGRYYGGSIVGLPQWAA
jgi:hypothetical protein